MSRPVRGCDHSNLEMCEVNTRRLHSFFFGNDNSSRCHTICTMTYITRFRHEFAWVHSAKMLLTAGKGLNAANELYLWHVFGFAVVTSQVCRLTKEMQMRSAPVVESVTIDDTLVELRY